MTFVRNFIIVVSVHFKVKERTMRDVVVLPYPYLPGGHGRNTEDIKNAPMFRKWCTRLDPRFGVKSVFIDSYDDLDSRLQFIKFHSADEVYGKRQVVFMRGDSVGMLVILRSGGRDYAIMTKQARLAVGVFEHLEIPAGSMDNDGAFVGAAAHEIKKELELDIPPNELIELYPSMRDEHYIGIAISPGACDERMRFFYTVRNVTPEELVGFEGKCTGLHEEGEYITLTIIPLDSLINVPDAKTIIAFALYKYATNGHR